MRYGFTNAKDAALDTTLARKGSVHITTNLITTWDINSFVDIEKNIARGIDDAKWPLASNAIYVVCTCTLFCPD